MGPPPRLRIDDIELEIAALTESLSGIVERSPAEPPTEKEVWLVYARSERAVAKLRYRLGTERPGVFSELPKSKRPDEFLTHALEGLNMAAAKMKTGELADGLEALRGARTCLRAYLAELVRIRMREKRKASLSRRSSSSSS
jgi:hypothetical protein